MRYADVDGLARQMGLGELARANLGVQLADGKRVIRLREGRKTVVLEFGDDGRLMHVRQNLAGELEGLDWDTPTVL